MRFGAEEMDSENLIVVCIGNQFDQSVGFAPDVGPGNGSGRQGHCANVMPFGFGLRLVVADAGKRRIEEGEDRQIQQGDFTVERLLLLS